MKLADLQHERNRVAVSMRKLNEDAGPDGNLTGEQKAKWESYKVELRNLDEKIERQQTIDEFDRRANGTPIHQAGNAEFDREKRNFSLCKLIASTFDNNVDAAREKEISNEQRRLTGKKGEGFLVPFECLAPKGLEQRVLTAAGDGSNLIGTQILGFIDVLRPNSVSMKLGATMITGLVGDAAFPRRDSRAPTAAWYTSNNSITSGDQSFDLATATARHLGVITEFDRKTQVQSSPSVEQETRNHLAAELAVALDLGIMKGAGAPAPVGITNTSNIHTKTSSSGDPTWADVLGVVAAVKHSNVPMTSLGWALNAYAEAKFKSITKVASDAGAGFLMSDDGRLGGAVSAVTSQLAGDPATSPATDGECVFGDWSQVLVALWSGVELLVNPYESTAYAKGNVSVRGLMDADVLVKHPAAFLHWTAIKTD